MHAPVTRETTRLDRNTPPESSLGVHYEAPSYSLKVVYKRTATPHRGNTPAAGAGLGVILGALLMAAVWAYGIAALGGATLAVLIVLAFWNATRE